MARYRRRSPTRVDTAASLGTSLLVGAGVAAAVFYVTRLFLARDTMEGGRIASGERKALPAPETAEPPGQEGR